MAISVKSDAAVLGEDPDLLQYRLDGEQRALELPNRGRLRLGPDGSLAPEILRAYRTHGFYIVEELIDHEEIAEIRSNVDHLLDRAPYPDASSGIDAKGRPAAGIDSAVQVFHMARALSDPLGGTDANGGRHPVPMPEPEAPATSALETYLIRDCLEVSPAFLRLYGHPDLLMIAAAIGGEDFVPFVEAFFIKRPGLGPSVAWHQDGQLHWERSIADADVHGFNFQVQLFGSTSTNGLWVVPGSHHQGRIDIPARVAANGGSVLLPDAVPVLTQPGDVVINNRQILHCSFANTSAQPRVSCNFGFLKRSAVLGQRGVLRGAGHIYTDEFITERARCIGVAIRARAVHRPEEPTFTYAPLGHEPWTWSQEDMAEILRDYPLRDIGI